jgi:hypothetical protein
MIRNLQGLRGLAAATDYTISVHRSQITVMALCARTPPVGYAWHRPYQCSCASMLCVYMGVAVCVEHGSIKKCKVHLTQALSLVHISSSSAQLSSASLSCISGVSTSDGWRAGTRQDATGQQRRTEQSKEKGEKSKAKYREQTSTPQNSTSQRNQATLYFYTDI